MFRPALIFAALFAFLGFADAAYLTADHYLALPLPCSLTGGCDAVLESSYSAIGPLPVAALGAAYYLLALLLAAYAYTAENVSRASRAVLAIWVLSGLGVLASAIFVYLQIAVIGAICAYCMISALTSILLFISSSVLVFHKDKIGLTGGE